VFLAGLLPLSTNSAEPADSIEPTCLRSNAEHLSSRTNDAAEALLALGSYRRPDGHRRLPISDVPRSAREAWDGLRTVYNAPCSTSREHRAACDSPRVGRQRVLLRRGTCQAGSLGKTPLRNFHYRVTSEQGPPAFVTIFNDEERLKLETFIPPPRPGEKAGLRQGPVDAKASPERSDHADRNRSRGDNARPATLLSGRAPVFRGVSGLEKALPQDGDT